ncbi:hypothetical protein POSPLADRAFT_1042115 [Postia placenta MAD-698-R-SB12]|uniref:S15/NS1 RNA-binding domain-containing protein n=1 Tax=Postia placenta MAD-698-R-SB12 TaxID=670580 RepID=A0A1X6NDT9_9APHY|nr:hypothetical protein POSPLADRAFT_1042115 [Postia placenta MAD-698-R-SB12]OSX66805.1 hypothetical protein POSPLADRAFT_1042115 [Postia placenta MAD-698-R-SB12]
MLRARLAQCSRAVASSSTAHTPSSSLHTSAVLQASALRKRKSRVAEKANIEKRDERERAAQANRPHVVLGYRPGDEVKWQSCDLARVIVTERDILAAPIPPMEPPKSDKDVHPPAYMNYGVGPTEKELLFDVLPTLSVQGTALRREAVLRMSAEEPRFDINKIHSDQFLETQKAIQLTRLVDLRNANARGIAYENRKRIVAEFSEPENPTDTGRPEVQAALLTLRIRTLWEHLNNFKKDISNRRSLRRLIHQRAKVLRYLKRLDRDRYDNVLGRLGLEPESVEGELVV